MNITAFRPEWHGSRPWSNRKSGKRAPLSGNSNIWGRTNVFFSWLSRLGHLSHRLKLEHPFRPVSRCPQEIVRGQLSFFSGGPQSSLAAGRRIPVCH